jgi:hypothetical protein
MMLLSGYPMFIWWSADLYMFHNDAYAPTLVGRHEQTWVPKPDRYGRTCGDSWEES